VPDTRRPLGNGSEKSKATRRENIFAMVGVLDNDSDSDNDNDND
jgi:hypothetical protein